MGIEFPGIAEVPRINGFHLLLGFGSEPPLASLGAGVGLSSVGVPKQMVEVIVAMGTQP